MSGHNPLREDKTCLNCRHVVEKRYCSNCGQENTSSRKTFHHLFIHFFEDLTHYENAFWKTIRHLLFKPGRLTKEYLSGKRLSYLAPIRLYIFISFVTFFLLGVLPDPPEKESDKTKKEQLQKEIRNDDKELVIPTEGDGTLKIKKDTTWGKKGFGNYRSLKQFDSVQNSLPKSEKLTGFRYKLERKLSEIREKSGDKNFEKQFTEGFMRNVPKALFLYMPLFAFWLWIFHGKRRWYYFDHGIFTLHYFSFLLLTLCIVTVIDTISEFADFAPLSFVAGFLWLVLFCWWFFYFFRSHSNFYGEPKAISRLKGIALYFINMFLISIFSLGLLIYTILYLP